MDEIKPVVTGKMSVNTKKNTNSTFWKFWTMTILIRKQKMTNYYQIYLHRCVQFSTETSMGEIKAIVTEDCELQHQDKKTLVEFF